MDNEFRIAPGDNYLEKASEVEILCGSDGSDFKNVINALADLLNIQTTRNARHVILLYVVQALAVHFAMHSGIALDDLGVRDLGLQFPGDDESDEVYTDAVEACGGEDMTSGMETEGADMGADTGASVGVSHTMNFLRLN